MDSPLGIGAGPIGHLEFMLFNADTILPLSLGAIAFVAALASRDLRACLKDRLIMAAYIATFLAWALLIPWGATWLDAVNGHPSPGWAFWPIFAEVFGWPVIAALLVFRSRGARGVALTYVLCCAPGWLLCWVTCGMAVGGEW